MPAGRRYGGYRDYGAVPPMPPPNKPIVHTFETESTCASRCVHPCKRHNFETLMTRWVCPTSASSASSSAANQNPHADYNWLDDGIGAYDALDSLEGSRTFGGDRNEKLRINQYFIVLFLGLVLLLVVLIIIVARKCRKRVVV